MSTLKNYIWGTNIGYLIILTFDISSSQNHSHLSDLPKVFQFKIIYRLWQMTVFSAIQNLVLLQLFKEQQWSIISQVFSFPWNCAWWQGGQGGEVTVGRRPRRPRTCLFSPSCFSWLWRTTRDWTDSWRGSRQSPGGMELCQSETSRIILANIWGYLGNSEPWATLMLCSITLYNFLGFH